MENDMENEMEAGYLWLAGHPGSSGSLHLASLVWLKVLNLRE